MEVIDGALPCVSEVAEHMSLRLGDAQVLKRPFNPQSHGVRGALQRRNNERSPHLFHTISYYTQSDY
jgi:hypothetical protein